MAALTRFNQALLGAVVIVQLFFLVDGAAIFPHYWQTQDWSQWMPVYFALTAGAFVLSFFFAGKGGVYSSAAAANPNLGFSDPLGIFPMGLVYFVALFIVAVVLFQFPPLRIASEVPSGDAVPTALFTIFVVGFTETLLFQWFIISFLWPLMRWWSLVVSAVTFDVFHWAHYGGDASALAFILILGLALAALYAVTRREGGMMAPWGFHSGYDLGTYGVVTVQTLAVVIHPAVVAFLGFVLKVV